jgi:hypothetical protein
VPAEASETASTCETQDPTELERLGSCSHQHPTPGTPLHSSRGVLLGLPAEPSWRANSSDGTGDYTSFAPALSSLCVTDRETTPVPPRPPVESGTLCFFYEGASYRLGYTLRSKKGAYRIWDGDYSVIGEFPFTDGGWEAAWEEFTKLEPEYRAYEPGLANSGGSARTAASDLVRLSPCTYLGGYGSPLEPGDECELLFGPSSFEVSTRVGEAFRATYSEINALEISGRGPVTQGGGFIGGGFGVPAAIGGMAAAALLNAATTRTSMETALRAECRDAELFFHVSTLAPGPVRIALSRAYARIRSSQAELAVQRGEGSNAPSSMIEQLERLSHLFREGLLSDQEFTSAKERLFTDAREPESDADETTPS